MYFIELLIRHFKKKKENQQEFYDPLNVVNDEEEICEHVFMPIDATGEILACKKCGQLVNRKDLKDINFFRNK